MIRQIKQLRNITDSSQRQPATVRDLAAKAITMEDVTRLDIQRDGLSQPQPLASARTEAEQRHKEYMAHLDRMKWDDDYRYKWEQREKDMEEAKQRNYYY